MVGSKDLLIKIMGDNKNLKSSMNDSDKSVDSFTQKVTKVGPAMAASLAIGTAAFVTMAVKMAAAEEVVGRQTESLLKSQGVMWNDVNEELTDYINNLETLTAYGDTDIQLAFNRMISSGISYERSMESLNMVTDIAYTRNISLVAASDLVAKAYNGQASSLKRYGIVVEDGVTGLEALDAVQGQVNKNFADASDRVDTLEGKMELMRTKVDDTAEAFGNKLIPQLSYYMDAVIEASGGTENLGESIGELVTFPGEVIKDVGEYAAVTKSAFDINMAGIKTQKETVDILGLQKEQIVKMTDDEFRLKILILERQGFEEKSLEIVKERNETIKIMNQYEEKTAHILAAKLAYEEKITEENEKQLTLTQRKAEYDKTNVAAIKRKIGGTSSMSATTAAILGVTDSDRINKKITGGETHSQHKARVASEQSGV